MYDRDIDTYLFHHAKEAPFNPKNKTMEFHGTPDEQNFDEWLKPLFDAIMEGKTITSITIMAGTINREDPSKDQVLTQVKPVEYWQGLCSGIGHDGKSVKHDYVDAGPKNFYMSWVRSFTL